MRNGHTTGFETKRFTKDGRTLDISISAATFKDHDGKVQGLVVNLRDITQRKRAESELKDSEARLKHMVELAGDWFWELDADLRFTEVSPKFFAMAKVPREGIIGKTRWEYVSPEKLICDPARWKAHIEDLKNHRAFHNFEYGLVASGENRFFMSLSGVPLFDEKGVFTGYRGSGMDITERVLANMEIESSAIRLQKILDHSPIGVGISRIQDGYLHYSNDQLERMAGVPLTATSVKDTWVNPDMRVKFVEHFKKHGFVPGTPVQLFREDGSKLWCILSWTKIDYLGEESVAYWVYDIDELKKTQEALQDAHDELEEKVKERTAELEQSRRNFTQAFHESPAWMCITDMENGRFIEVNEAYSSGLGRTREELIGRTTLEAAIWPSPEVRKKWVQAVRSGAENGSPGVMEVGLLHKDGSVRTVTGSVGTMQWGGKQVFVSNAIDMTEQMEAQAALRESELRYRTILDNTGTAMAILNENALITFANPVFQQLIGYSREELVGKKKWTEFVHEDDLEFMLDYARQRRKHVSGIPSSYEFRLIDRSGEVKNVINTVAMLPDTNHNISSLLDITELKQAQEELARHRDQLEDMVGERTVELRKALAEKEVLLKEIHHRVKNNMAVVSSLLNLQSNKVQDLEVQMALQESQNRVQAMALIHETLYQSDSLAQVDLQSYIDKLMASLVSIFHGKLSGVTFHVDTDEVKLEVSQAVPCGLIINELITNSFKYAFAEGARGEVRITASLLPDNVAELKVRDTGVGFPSNLDLENTTSLGLRLIGLMVEQLHGNWELRNQDGAQVIIRWPLNRE